jgi:CheY-like chemotaxis protein
VNVIATVHNYLQLSRHEGLIDMAEYLPKLCESLKDALLGQRAISLTTTAIAVQLPPDKALAIGVIVNELVTNAIKYAFDEDGAGRVIVDLSRKGEELVLRVEDTGTRLSNECRARIGLASCHDVCQPAWRRGDVGRRKAWWLRDNESFSGTSDERRISYEKDRFFLTPATQPPFALKFTRRGGLTELDLITVLVVEDDAFVRLDLAQTLEAKGYKTIEAANAAEALVVLEANLGIRVVFTDIQMPGAMDGLALSHYVRKRWPPTIIVVSSGRCIPNAAEMAEGARFLPKPYPPHVLGKVLDDIREELAA